MSVALKSGKTSDNVLRLAGQGLKLLFSNIAYKKCWCCFTEGVGLSPPTPTTDNFSGLER